MAAAGLFTRNRVKLHCAAGCEIIRRHARIEECCKRSRLWWVFELALETEDGVCAEADRKFMIAACVGNFTRQTGRAKTCFRSDPLRRPGQETLSRRLMRVAG